MKRLILFYLTAITSVWFIRQFLSGFSLATTVDVFLTAALITLAIWGLNYILKKMKTQGIWLYLLIGILLTFFVLYLGSLVISGISITGGSLKELDLAILSTPTINTMDSILTLIFASLISMLVATITKWSVKE